jgi:hypothetical protein
MFLRGKKKLQGKEDISSRKGCIKENMQGNNPLPIYETKTIIRLILGQNTIQYKLDVIGNGLHSTIMHRALTIFTHLRFLMIAPSEC